MPSGQGRQAPLGEIDADSPASKDAYIDADHARELTWPPQYRGIQYMKRKITIALTIAGFLNAYLRDFAYAPLRIAKQRESFENPALHAPRTAHGPPITRRINS